MPVDASAQPANQILQWFVLGLRAKLNFNETNCYPAVVPFQVEGMDNEVIQVIPEATSKYGPGNGLQDGGRALYRRMTIRCAYWFQYIVDQHQRADQALTVLTNGLMDRMNEIRGVFALTNFNNPAGSNPLLVELVKYEAETATMEIDQDQHLFRRDIVFAVMWVEPLPTAVTLNTDDIADISL